MSGKKISLYYKDGSSDKVYHAQMEAQEAGYVVNFQYGRRGATLTAGTKTKEPIDLAKAEKTFNALIKEKTGKGYTEGEDGAVFQSQDLAERVTGIVPQLLNDIDEDELEELLRNPDWFMQEKHDGRRLLVKKSAGECIAINKKGLAILVPQMVIDLIKSVPQDIVVDGEIIGERYYIFDLLEFDGQNIRQTSAKERFSRLSSIAQLQTNVVGTYFTEQEKRRFFAELKTKDREGAVFKKVDSPYVPGLPASGGNQRKFKFWASATVEVVSNHKTKRSVGVAVYKTQDNREQEKIVMGNVTIPANHEIPAVGEIVEVVYLYCHVGGALYQSKYKGVRDDQGMVDCLYSKLKFKASVDEDE